MAARGRRAREPSAEDRDVGRTESHLAGLSFGFDDRPSLAAQAPLWTRPGHGTVERASVLPPPAPEPLAFEQVVELAVVAVADLEPGRTLRLRPHAAGHRVEPAPDSLTPPERVRVMRLTVVVRPVGS